MSGKKTTFACDCLHENSCERGRFKVDCIACLDCLQLLLEKNATRSWSTRNLFAVFAGIFSLTIVEKAEIGEEKRRSASARDKVCNE